VDSKDTELTLVRNGFKTGLLEKVTWQDYSILTRDYQNIIARVYTPKPQPKPSSPDTNTPLLPVYLYFHGGGHLYGNVDGEDASCSRIVAESPGPGIIVVNVNYRHTPEFVWPTQLDDAWDSFVWLSQHIVDTIGGDPGQVVVGGISAGGGLAASVVLRYHRLLGQASLTTSPSPSPVSGLTVRGQVLGSPWLLHPSATPNPLRNSDDSHHPLSMSSFTQNQDAPVLPWSIVKVFADLLGPAAVSDPSFNVALATDEQIKEGGGGGRGLPKTCSLIAGQDLLRDEGLYYAERLKANGIPTRTYVFPGLPHGFRRFQQLWSTNKWDELTVQSIQWCLSDDVQSSFDVVSKR
jgi:acetyl esterase/lipase